MTYFLSAPSRVQYVNQAAFKNRNYMQALEKKHIHKAKCTVRKTRFQQFKMDFGHHMKTLTGLKNQKAIKTVQICEAIIIV